MTSVGLRRAIPPRPAILYFSPLTPVSGKFISIYYSMQGPLFSLDSVSELSLTSISFYSGWSRFDWKFRGANAHQSLSNTNPFFFFWPRPLKKFEYSFVLSHDQTRPHKASRDASKLSWPFQIYPHLTYLDLRFGPGHVQSNAQVHQSVRTS